MIKRKHRHTRRSHTATPDPNPSRSAKRLNVYSARWLPLYEAKMLNHWNHRFSTYAQATQAQLNKGTLPRLDEQHLDDPNQEPLARYWIEEKKMDKAAPVAWNCGWFLGWRDITNASNERTFIPSVLPRTAVGHKFPVAVFHQTSHAPLLQAIWSSLAFDYVARQKLSGTGMTYFIVKQHACPTPDAFDGFSTWVGGALDEFVCARVLELTYTSNRIRAYAEDITGADPGPPFRWLPKRREQLRAELDAAILHLYGLDRSDTEHVLDSFFVIRKNEEHNYGEFVTKRLVLAAYDAMVTAASTGEPYRSPLTPPPGEGPRHTGSGT